MSEPIWLSVSSAFLGLAEIPGAASNPVIIRWAKDLGIENIYTNDDEAWCAVFLNRLFKACQLPIAGKGYDLLRARSFATWGLAVPAPALGAVLVFQRPGGGHVGLYLGESKTAYRVRGGNTSNAVGDAWLAKDRLIATRWPTTGDYKPGRVFLTDDGQALSTNEN